MKIRAWKFATVIAALVSASASRAIATATPVSSAAPTKHMLFKIRGPNGATVYLLGSVHLLTPDAGALPPEVDSAFARAKTVAFETSIDSVQMRAMEMVSKARYANGASLKTSLSPAGLATADSILKLYGISIEQVNGFKPWFVSVLLTQLVMQKAGFQPQYGVDIQLNQRAKAANKSIIGLESVDFQMGLFGSIDPMDQEKMIATSKGPADAAKELEQIKRAWMTGDTASLEAAFKDDSVSPAMVDVMLNNRNASWIPRIDELLKGKDDALVVVGAAHLVGKKGVLALLKAKGYRIEQL